jgi:hypothetical protein
MLFIPDVDGGGVHPYAGHLGVRVARQSGDGFLVTAGVGDKISLDMDLAQLLID